MVKELTGGYVIKYHANGLDKDPIEIDFTPPFRSAVFSCVPLFLLSLYLQIKHIMMGVLIFLFIQED